MDKNKCPKREFSEKCWKKISRKWFMTIMLSKIKKWEIICEHTFFRHFYSGTFFVKENKDI
jgi:hypothetical protein